MYTNVKEVKEIALKMIIKEYSEFLRLCKYPDDTKTTILLAYCKIIDLIKQDKASRDIATYLKSLFVTNNEILDSYLDRENHACRDAFSDNEHNYNNLLRIFQSI